MVYSDDVFGVETTNYGENDREVEGPGDHDYIRGQLSRYDQIVLYDDQQTLHIKLAITSGIDQIRIIVESKEDSQGEDQGDIQIQDFVTGSKALP